MNKVQKILYVIVFAAILFPITAQANESLTCVYQYGTTNLTFQINEDQLSLPFSEGMKKNGFTWHYEDKFAENYAYSSIEDDKYVCPTLEIEAYRSAITVFTNAKDRCNGTCTQIVAEKAKGSKTTVKALSTKIYGSVGIYNSKKYFLPSFRVLSDGSKEWSVNNAHFINIDEIAEFELDGNQVKIKIDGNLINKVYEKNSLVGQYEIYRCVIQTKNGYSYILSKSKGYCPRNDLSKKDGQATASQSYQTAQGADDDDDDDDDDGDDDYTPSGITKENIREWISGYNGNQDCNSIFGSVGDEGSVAWLINEVLDYLRILGPLLVLVLSSIDFTKAIIQNDDDTMKKAQKKLINRLLLAAVLFIIPSLVTLILEIFGFTSGVACGIK